MLCSKCGNQVADNAVVCPICAYQLQNNMPVQQSFVNQNGNVPYNYEPQQPKGSKKGTKIAIAILTVIAVVAVIVAVLALTGVIGGNENDVSGNPQAEEATKEDEFANLSDEEIIEIVISRHLSYIVDRDVDGFIESQWNYRIVNLRDEFYNNRNFLEETLLYYFDRDIKEIKNIEIVYFDLGELSQDDKDELENYMNEADEEYNLNYEHPEITHHCSVGTVCDVVYEDETEGQVEVSFYLYKCDGEWKIFMI